MITDRALMILRSIVQVSMLINVFLLVNEVFKEFYSRTSHVASSQYLLLRLAWAPCSGPLDLDRHRFQSDRHVSARFAGEPQPEVSECRLCARHRRHLD